MDQFQIKDGLQLYPVWEKKAQSALKSKEEAAARFPLSEMLEFLCSPQRGGRYRQCSLESDVEYLRWIFPLS